MSDDVDADRPAEASLQRPRLLFVFLTPASFVEDDRQLLAGQYDVHSFHFDTTSKSGSAVTRLLRFATRFIGQFAWLIRELPGSTGVYGWFADYHMVLPVLLSRLAGKRSVVVIGGFDGNTFPELKYGVFLSKWRAPLARLVVRRADLLLPNTPSLMFAERRYATWPDPRPNGLLVHVPELKTPYRVVPVGFSPEFWSPGPVQRPPVVCNVAFIRTDRDVYVKGLDVLLLVAALMPDVTFRVVGVTPEMAERLRANNAVSDNLFLLPPRPREELQTEYQAASVYIQLSRMEGGLPNVVGEAMLCGCIPVVSEVGNMPDTAGPNGFVAESPDPERIAEQVRKALAADPSLRRAVRQHIIDHYTIERRSAALAVALRDVYESGD